MIVGFKDLFRLIGISIVCFCAVFVSTFFLNFYLDILAIGEVPEGLTTLYNAQLAMAQFVSGICCGFLGAIAIVMLIFYIRLYINSHTVQLSTLKAMGYSNGEIALKFWVFGLSVLFGTALGYGLGHAVMPYIYSKMLIDGLPEVKITYHVWLLFALVVGPSAGYCLLSCLFAFLSLRRPVSELLHGKTEKIKLKAGKREKERPFLKDMLFKCVGSQKLLAFFVAFGAFCFSGMVQMSFSMMDLTANSMAEIILAVGLVLAIVSICLSVTALVNANAENVSIMRAYGYSLWECALAVFGGFVPFALLGFAIGTGYQYGLLSLMINLLFKDVEGVAEYHFRVGLLLETFAAFLVFFAGLLALYLLRMRRITLKQAANE